ncbi:cytochrome b [Pseudogemmobacter humi]|uniref:Cytochrome b561 n=1 Tax=Pseudogemmobacter humi TaxID=2483812 RepID=A0A3P5XFL3_9RHOB|nr:cytochrome b/b6 domain-containing protein [Pseudogemmobacter humi]VDC33622.1 cytochrome b561 [Pseudogemmobacter humi]
MITNEHKAAPAGYARGQIILHWLIAALVLAQLVVNEDIRAAFGARLTGATPLPPGAAFHLIAGLAVLGLMLIRIALRLIHGAPPPPPAPRVMQVVAEWAHRGLYALLLMMTLSGAAAWFWRSEAAGLLHDATRFALIGLILAHIAGALVEHYLIGNRAIRRMLTPSARASRAPAIAKRGATATAPAPPAPSP